MQARVCAKAQKLCGELQFNDSTYLLTWSLSHNNTQVHCSMVKDDAFPGADLKRGVATALGVYHPKVVVAEMKGYPSATYQVDVAIEDLKSSPHFKEVFQNQKRSIFAGVSCGECCEPSPERSRLLAR
jgi:hypothetical protein